MSSHMSPQHLSSLPLASLQSPDIFTYSPGRQALTHLGAAVCGLTHQPPAGVNTPPSSISRRRRVVYAPALPVQSFTCQHRLLVEVLWLRVPDQEPEQHFWACVVSAVSSVTDKLHYYLSHFPPELAAF